MASNLRRKLKKSYLGIKSHLGKRETSPWITDNFYLIQKHYKLAFAQKKGLECVEMYEILEAFCRQWDFDSDIPKLTEYLNRAKENYTYAELSSVTLLLSVCAINRIYESITDKGGELLEPAVKLLVSLSDPDYSEILPALWRPEALLSEQEEGYAGSNRETKEQYRICLAKYAKKHKMDESAGVQKLISEARCGNTSVGALLFKPDRSFAMLWIGISLVMFLALLFAGVVFVGWIAFLLAVPFALSSAAIADRLLSMVTPVYKAPRMDIDALPDDTKTLVAVAALMTGGRGDDEVFESLKRFRYMNPDENIYFCLLADLPDSNMQFRLEDSEIIEKAHRKIDELNRLHGDRFCLFFRERVLNKSENRFGGWERKRGAVCELVSHIVHGGKSEYYGGDFIREIKYLLTLDSDTNLSVGSVKEMLSVALHPVNRPVVSNGRVISGYGIIQPTVRTELASAYKTGFSRLISGAGGSDIYATAEFKRSQNLFGSGNFCGKGLINVELFEKLVCGKLPEGRILSHDVVEGSVLRTLCASDITLTDSTPGNTVSFFRRQHRWLRGDFQNLYFLKDGFLDPFSKLRLFATVLRHTSPVFVLSALIAGCFLQGTRGLALFVFAYSEFLLPCVLSVVCFLFSRSPFAVVRFFSRAYSLLTQTLFRLLFELVSTARKATLALHAYWLAAVRMITGKKTLEWTTAAQTEKLSSSLGKYVLDSVFSVIIGLAMLVFARPPFMRFAGLLFFVYPLVSVVLSHNINGGAIARPKLSERQKNTLLAHAADMFRFYYENIGENTHHLPPDNIQLSPVNSVAMRTSPTNIGFYLVSLLAARDFGIINSRLLAERLNDSVSVIEGLEKYKGNLYNWYDLNNLSVLGNGYVSTVDSGNFIVMLVALKEGLKEYSDEDEKLDDIINRCEKLISETELSVLYDKKRDLFYIGVTAPEGVPDKSYYDMLMSEARMTAYYAVASSMVPKKHWQNLGRTLTHKSGYMGMMSWSGTAFEYFMPQLFLPLYRDSFLYESVAFSVMVQKSENSVWGVSESGYYSFDSDMNYQYKANGIQTLALRRIAPDERIISPYSTYLSLCVCGDSAMKNLENLENRGMYGKYGLYEALDLNGESGICVKSYMAHHVGMSIIAIANAVKNNIFAERFMKDKCMCSAGELLQEKIPVDTQVFADNNAREPQKHKPIERRERTDKPNIHQPKAVMLNRGDLTAIISDSGHISLRSGDRLLTNTFFDKYSLRFTLGVVFSRGGRNYGCAPLYGNTENQGFEQGNGWVSHIASGKDFSGRVRYSMAKNCNCFIINTRAENLKKYDISLVFEPVLQDEKSFRSHISFSRLFLESEYDSARRILYFHRRSREDGRHIFTLAVAPGEKTMDCSFTTNKNQFPAGTVSGPSDYATAVTDNEVGACIDPLCLFRASESDGGRATFIITCGETKQECEKNIRIARGNREDYPSQPQNSMLEKVLPALLYNCRPKAVDEFSESGIGDLWSRSISGDYPLSVVTADKISKTRTEDLISAFLMLSKACIRTELVFIIADRDNYNRPVESSVREICTRLGANQYIGKSGGIFLLREGEISPQLKKALQNSARYCTDMGTVEKLYFDDVPLQEIITSPKNAFAVPLPKEGIPSRNGYFIREGFVVDKSRMPYAPYSFVLTGHRFSAVVTHSSLGYTFFDNARERRLCAFCGDGKSIDDGERIFALRGGKKYDLCAFSQKVVYEKGRATYFGEIEGNAYSVTVAVHPKVPVKLIKIQYERTTLATEFELRPVMGDSVFPISGIEAKKYSIGNNSCLMFRNTFGMTYPEGRGFAGVCGGNADAEKCTLDSEGGELIFFIGSCATEGGAKAVSQMVNKSFFEETLAETMAFSSSFLPEMRFSTENAERDALVNFFLPYQIAACRFFARGSFYQSGGAYGFRDQLQDCLSLVYAMPKTVRTHIIRCCAHQYSDGSVMHWWHTRHYGRVNRGIKSKCSDDMLYLPIVFADYIEKTGDISLADVSVRYITSTPLGSKNERYEQPNLSDVSESVYKHCLRALEYASSRRGENRLLLMGSCDWNDAFSLVGEKGRGESVFSSMLFIIAAEAFIPVAKRLGDIRTAEHYRNAAAEMRKIIEEKAYFTDRYARAICDDGTVLGISGCEECEIDILSQAFAALAGLDRERTVPALKLAFSKLYDPKNRIFKLFSPPFANGKVRVGYIRGYVAGIRENGGQYTHGALWGALGCISAGMYEEGLKILDCADPASRMKDKDIAKLYKTEPYVIAADIYSGQYGGRGGWSWYTGAASWFYKIMLEYVFGLKFADGKLVSANPIIPFSADITFNNIYIRITASEKYREIKLNGKPVSLPLEFGDKSDMELPLK